MANLKRLMKKFGEDVGKLKFSTPVAYVYNPLDYAWAGQEAFIDKFFHRRDDSGAEADAEERPTVLVGMNPGPYGMTQSGVSFGAPKIVKSWMGIDLPPDAIRPPAVVCPSRPIFGFSPVPITTSPASSSSKKRKRKTPSPRVPALREEVSGKRIYIDWAMNTYPSAEAFFSEYFIHPYCPMQFMTASGTNITPDQLHRDDRAALYGVCDRYLRRVLRVLRPKRVIGIGNFADERIRDTLKHWREGNVDEEEEDDDDGKLLAGLFVGKIPHPSPRSPMARVAWGDRGARINQLLREFGVEVPYTVPDMADIAQAEEGLAGDEEKTAARRTKRRIQGTSDDRLPISKRRHAKRVRSSLASAK